MPFLQLLWLLPLWACCTPLRRATLGKLEPLHPEGPGNSLIPHLPCYRMTHAQQLNSAGHKPRSLHQGRPDSMMHLTLSCSLWDQAKVRSPGATSLFNLFSCLCCFLHSITDFSQEQNLINHLHVNLILRLCF